MRSECRLRNVEIAILENLQTKRRHSEGALATEESPEI